MVELRRELSLINKHLGRHERTAGESVVWYEFLPLDAGSTFSDLYDESPEGPLGLAYKPGVVIPTIYVEEVEDNNRAIEEGRQPTQNINFLTRAEDMIKAGVTEAWEYQQRMKDLFFYDGRYYMVVDYKVRGRLRNDVVIAVDGKELYIDQEMPNDVFSAAAPFVQDYPWPDTFPK